MINELIAAGHGNLRQVLEYTPAQVELFYGDAIARRAGERADSIENGALAMAGRQAKGAIEALRRVLYHRRERPDQGSDPA